uniref:Uncharacterized protein n=1 Tax=Malurus cyaneus samueli TaxID=2593467 RepID=A0A8C5X7K4_9PASS
MVHFSYFCILESEDCEFILKIFFLVKCTGSVRYTRLDSLLMEAAMTWELTAIVLFRPAKSLPNFMVAFSVLRKRPKLL